MTRQRAFCAGLQSKGALPNGLSTCRVTLEQEGCLEEAIVQFEKGARVEERLGACDHAAMSCQCCLARALLQVCKSKLNAREGHTPLCAGGGCTPSEDVLPLMIFFWARRAARSSFNESALGALEGAAHSKHGSCNKPDPQMKCSKCRTASCCDRACQMAGGPRKLCLLLRRFHALATSFSA